MTYNQEYYKKNKERIKQKVAIWCKKNKEKIRKYKKEWARKKYGYALKGSTTYKGRKYELLALKLFPNSVYQNKKIMNRPFDILWENKKIDVKSCELFKRKTKRGKPVKECGGWWVFNKNKNDADLYFCICLINKKPIKYYLIPKEYFKKGVSIGKKSRFDKFIFYSK